MIRNLLIAAALSLLAPALSDLAAQEAAAPAGADTTYATQESSGEVTLTVTPRWRDGALVVEVRANTHSVALSDIDLESQVRLRVADTVLAPTEAGTLDGHHATAELIFQLRNRPSQFTIEIAGVPDVTQRTLRWPREATTQP